MSYKIEKVNSLLREEISNILNKSIRIFGLGFVTITFAECAKDLRSARVWVSIFENQENNLKILNDHKREIQKELNKRIDLKYVPRIHFRLDKSLDNYDRIEKLLKDEEKKLE